MPTGFAANRYSMEKREKESDAPYTFGDLAAARFAVYGILDERFRTPQPETREPLSRLDAVAFLWSAFAEKNSEEKGDVVLYDSLYDKRVIRRDDAVISFTDVPEEYEASVAWAYRNGVAHGMTDAEFGVYDISETAFVAMLLNVMGYQSKFENAYALKFAESIGIAPVGLSRGFTLGDAALYLQSALGCPTPDGTAVRDRIKIREGSEQATFPATIRLTPLFPEDAERQLREATRYLAETVEIRGDCLPKEDVLNLYARYYDKTSGDWYAVRISGDYSLDIRADTFTIEALPEEKQAELKALLDSLREGWLSETLSDLDYMRESDLALADCLYNGGLRVNFSYNEAWELARDLDDAFTLYKNDAITRKADEFYRERVAGAKNDVDKVSRAKNAINRKASYAPATGYDDLGACYAPEAHSIEGFFNNGQIVCDGYASVFQYLMLRSGVDCVIVHGSTVSAEAAEEGYSDHAWSKVKVNGVWRNEDVCWSDTGYPYLFDLRDDAFYARHRHWAVTFTDL